MSSEIAVQNNILAWAIHRAGFDLQTFTEKHPNVGKWLKGEKNPTVKQLEDFSKQVYLPFGYLLLKEPPKEKMPIPFFRTNNTQATEISINIYDTVLLMQQRQGWLKEYLKDNDFEILPFVGKFSNSTKVKDIVNDIRETLGLPESWASHFKTWYEAQDHLVTHIEDSGIVTVFNGVVENNGHRKIPVNECRGFVLVDEIAPFMFINNADYKSAQMFTIAHELAHIWIGHSAGFDYAEMLPANDPIERLCDKVAAEFLVPEDTFVEVWQEKPNIKDVARFFKVSEIVIARRALDIGVMTKRQFLNFYEAYANREFTKKESQAGGGDFYATTKKRLSITFASHINNAVKSGVLLYRDAYKLTGLKGDTFQNFFSKHF